MRRKAGELLCPNNTLESASLRELALPFAVALLLRAPIVRFLGRELAGMVSRRLSTGERPGDCEHVRRILGLYRLLRTSHLN